MSITTAHLLIGALATYRATKLVIDDEITAELRNKAFEALDAAPPSLLTKKLSYFLTCPWCVSVWVATALLTLRLLSPATYEYFASILSFSAVTGVIDARL